MTQAVLKKKSFNILYILVGIMLLCSAMTGILPQSIISLAMVASLLGLFVTDNVYIAYPFVLFYNELYGVFMGLSVYRIFSFVFLLSFLIKLNTHAKMDTKKLLPIAVYVLYCIGVMGNIEIQRAIFALLDVICVVCFAGELMDKEKIKKFFTVYTLICFIACFTGIVMGNSANYDFVDIEVNRFMATFQDPNYMGMFYTIAIFAIVTLKLFSPKIRVIVVVLLYAIVLASLSVTAILLNSILWLIYLFISKKINIKSLMAIVLIAFILVGLYNYGLNNPDAPVVGALSFRLEKKISQLESGDFGDATTARSDFSEQHLEYFSEQPFWKQLIGGTPVNATYISPELVNAAHNEYIDMLLNVGIIGAVILLGYMALKLWEYIKKYNETNDEHYLCLVMYKFVWCAYATALTLFLDHRFMLIFFA